MGMHHKYQTALAAPLCWEVKPITPCPGSKQRHQSEALDFGLQREKTPVGDLLLHKHKLVPDLYLGGVCPALGSVIFWIVPVSPKVSPVVWGSHDRGCQALAYFLPWTLFHQSWPEPCRSRQAPVPFGVYSLQILVAIYTALLGRGGPIPSGH